MTPEEEKQFIWDRLNNVDIWPYLNDVEAVSLSLRSALKRHMGLTDEEVTLYLKKLDEENGR